MYACDISGCVCQWVVRSYACQWVTSSVCVNE